MRNPGASTLAVPPLACDAHMHVFDPRFPASPHWQRTPPVATVAHYRPLQQALGLQRAVVVTPSTYATDNRCTVDALGQLGERARGVAVVDVDVSAGELERLGAAGVRGLRVNFHSPQSWGVTTPERLARLAHLAADMGWHVQVLLHPEHLLRMADLLAALPAPLVIDHLGRLEPAEGLDGAPARVLLRLLEGGRTWLKLSAAYMTSCEGAPRYGDVATLCQALLRRAPQRMLWGTDWPHTTEPLGSVDDHDLLRVLTDACGDAETLRTVLVDNPCEVYGFERA